MAMQVQPPDLPSLTTLAPLRRFGPCCDAAGRDDVVADSEQEAHRPKEGRHAVSAVPAAAFCAVSDGATVAARNIVGRGPRRSPRGRRGRRRRRRRRRGRGRRGAPTGCRRDRRGKKHGRRQARRAGGRRDGRPSAARVAVAKLASSQSGERRREEARGGVEAALAHHAVGPSRRGTARRDAGIATSAKAPTSTVYQSRIPSSPLGENEANSGSANQPSGESGTPRKEVAERGAEEHTERRGDREGGKSKRLPGGRRRANRNSMACRAG